ncbi:MAG TPA: glycosyltransferase family 2 protein [Candidatus Anammoximicrobium sp.]|nr:glycosyltransferase family 2 protein [Candidatus Anammoximicrobium sp.]
MNSRWLTALPVFNEVRYVDGVLDEVSEYSPEILVVDDGSTDGTGELLGARSDIEVVRHPRNRGYGAALNTAFQFAIRKGYDYLVTIDCDGQHEPQRIPQFVAACHTADIVSGSRYLRHFDGDSEPPADRQRINRRITDELNRRLGLQLTDAFCGFKAYRVSALRRLHLREAGYAMPIELWVQAVAARLEIIELPVPLVYLDESRSFGGELDNAATRLEHYYDVLERSLEAVRTRGEPAAAEVLSGAC